MLTTAVDLFAGLGGNSEGARLAGLRVLAAANHWPLAVETHKANHPETEHYCQVERASYSEAIGEEGWEMDGQRNPGWLVDFADSIARAFSCQAIFSKFWKQGSVRDPVRWIIRVRFIGHLSDAQVCRYLFDTLSRKLVDQAREEGKEAGRRSHGLIRFVAWYVRAAGFAIRERIEESRHPSYTPASCALVEVKDKAVVAWVEAKFPKLGKTSESRAQRDRYAVRRGFAAGQEIELQQGVEHAAAPIAALEDRSKGGGQ